MDKIMTITAINTRMDSKINGAFILMDSLIKKNWILS